MSGGGEKGETRRSLESDPKLQSSSSQLGPVPLPHQGTCGNVYRHFWLSQRGEGSATAIQWGEARDEDRPLPPNTDTPTTIIPCQMSTCPGAESLLRAAGWEQGWVEGIARTGSEQEGNPSSLPAGQL